MSCAARSASSSPTRSERTLAWPLAEGRRTRVKGQISAAELPVSTRSGNPAAHTLVLTRTEELFRCEAAASKDATASLEWLAALSGR